MKQIKIILSVLAFTYSFAALGSVRPLLCNLEIEQSERCIKFEKVEFFTAACVHYDRTGNCRRWKSTQKVKEVCVETEVQNTWSIDIRGGSYEEWQKKYNSQEWQKKYNSQAEGIKKIYKNMEEGLCM